MTDQEYIKALELRLEHAAEQQRAMQVSVAAILSEREKEKECFDSRETIMRDTFASSAMNGLLASCSDQAADWPEPERVAEIAYKVADAMLAERKPQPE